MLLDFRLAGLVPRVLQFISSPHRNHIPGGARLAIICPRLHQCAPLLQGIAAPVSLFDRVASRVRQRLLGDLAREARFLAAPIPESRPNGNRPNESDH
jgi:hypothetical protein